MVLAVSLVEKSRGWINSIFRVPKKLSAIVLSQQLALFGTVHFFEARSREHYASFLIYLNEFMAFLVGNCPMYTMKLSLLKLLPVLLFAALYGVPAEAKPRIADDSYFYSAPGDYGFVVKGNRYYWIELGDNTPPAWRSTSELRQVKAGVILAGNKYFCSLNSLEKIRKKKPSFTIANCTRNGWTKP
jgi:hypothetical protein